MGIKVNAQPQSSIAAIQKLAQYRFIQRNLQPTHGGDPTIVMPSDSRVSVPGSSTLGFCAEIGWTAWTIGFFKPGPMFATRTCLRRSSLHSNHLSSSSLWSITWSLEVLFPARREALLLASRSFNATGFMLAAKSSSASKTPFDLAAARDAFSLGRGRERLDGSSHEWTTGMEPDGIFNSWFSLFIYLTA